MRTAAIALVSLAAAAAVGVPASGGDGAGVCEQMTAQRLLENPRFARRWGDAVRSGDPTAIDAMNRAVSRLRALHGCDGEAPEAAPGEDDDPGQALPPGHPPVDGGDPGSLIFEEPFTVTI